MTASLIEALLKNPVLPLMIPEAVNSGLTTARALQAGGVRVVEVAQRTDCSLECLATIAQEAPELVVGAGTVLSADQAIACIDAGARFIVSPGLDKNVVSAAASRDIVAVPGVMTPTELQQALNLDLTAVKFFPAATAGGVAAVKALSEVFPSARFIPTGGISATNLADYIAVDSVLACGGSWMTPRDIVRHGDFARITSLAVEALAIAAKAREN